MSIDVARLVRVPISDAAVRRVVATTVRTIRQRVWRAHDSRLTTHDSVSVAFIGPARMRTLNRTYHEEDRVTDVLAFPAGEREETRNSKLETRNKSKGQISKFGELVLCPSYVRRQAARAGEPFRRELTRVLVHGMLHLLGYDHRRPREAEEMFRLQERIVARIDIP